MYSEGAHTEGILMAVKTSKKLTLKERKMAVDELSGDTGLEIDGPGVAPESVEERIELSETQGLAVHLLQERENRQSTVLEMNDLLKALDSVQAENAVLRRALYQERINNITRDNDELRRKYKLPHGNANYAVDGGKMFLVRAAGDQSTGE